jgi:hypothetical protein
MFGEQSFETNPSLEEGQGGRGRRLAASRNNGGGSYRFQSQGAQDEELTAASHSSQQSEVEPSFFIIPPKENDNFQEQRRLPWEKNASAKNNNETNAADAILSVTSSGTYNIFGAYRRDRLVRDIDTAGERGTDGHAAILKTLKRAGVLIFIIDSKVSGSVADIMDSVENVITHTRKMQRETNDNMEYEKKDGGDGRFTRAVYDVSNKNQWCLLYRDPDGRLFNLTLAPHTTALAGEWEGLLQSFSVVQALTILVVLSRSFSCSTSGKFLRVGCLNDPSFFFSYNSFCLRLNHGQFRPGIHGSDSRSSLFRRAQLVVDQCRNVHSRIPVYFGLRSYDTGRV